MIKLFLLFIFCGCNNSNEIVKPTQNYTPNKDEIELAELINKYRVYNLKTPLIHINHISYKSQEHNLYMIEKGVLSHDNFKDRANNLMNVLGAVKVSENIGYNYSTPNAVLNAWINSPEHKHNLDSDYTHFGIAISVDKKGKKYYTNMFMK